MSDEQKKVLDKFAETVKEHLEGIKKQLEKPTGDEHVSYLKGSEAAWMSAWYAFQEALLGQVVSIKFVEKIG